MTVKFTKCGVGAESGDESLLFEFLDHELPEFVEFEYTADLIKNKFVGSLQTSQHNGTFLEPINIDFEFFGQYVNKNGSLINAKQRLDELLRIQNRVIKFWFEGIKQLVIIEKVKFKIHNYQRITGTISLVPHDLQIAISPQTVEKTKLQSYILTQTSVEPSEEANGGKPDFGLHAQIAEDPFKVQKELKEGKIRILKNSIKEEQSHIQQNLSQIEELKKSKLKSGAKAISEELLIQNKNSQSVITKLQKEIDGLSGNLKDMAKKGSMANPTIYKNPLALTR